MQPAEVATCLWQDCLLHASKRSWSALRVRREVSIELNLSGGRFCCCAQVMSIAQMIGSEYGGSKDLSAIGGVETGRDAAEFILLGANSVQVCPTAWALCISITVYFLCELHCLASVRLNSVLIWRLPLQRLNFVLQVCTGVMLHGYPLVKQLCGSLQVWPMTFLSSLLIFFLCQGISDRQEGC